MRQEAALAIMIALALGIIVLLVWSWWRRSTRDSAPLVQPGELPASATVLAAFETFYVATTKKDLPLERIAAPGLAFRDRAALTIADAGVAIDFSGPRRIVLTPDRIVDVGQSTVVIDRVVESGGLTRLTWRTDADTVVDSYFRPQDASARALADAISSIIPESPQTAHPQTPTPTGTDA